MQNTPVGNSLFPKTFNAHMRWFFWHFAQLQWKRFSIYSSHDVIFTCHMVMQDVLLATNTVQHVWA